MNQLALPVDVAPHEIMRKTSLGAAIELCAEVGGFEPKQIVAKLKLDKAQWSRWTSGQEGIVWPKLSALMDEGGNDAPLLWMAHARGYDIASMRKRESELEAQLRRVKEENAALRRVLQGGN